MNNFRLYSGERFSPFWSIGGSGITGPTGDQGVTGDQGITGPTGDQGYLSGVTYYLNYSQTGDVAGTRYMRRTPSLAAQSTAATGVSNSGERQVDGTFTTAANMVPNSNIPPGEWNLHFHGSVNGGSSTSLYSKIYTCSPTGSD